MLTDLRFTPMLYIIYDLLGATLKRVNNNDYLGVTISSDGQVWLDSLWQLT